MKIEMGESLLYSWLRHVKECQLVQTNWKPSTSWQLQNEQELQRFFDDTDKHFKALGHGYDVYGNNSLSQLLTQAEVDVLGIAISDDGMEIYATDVAFHENGLNYGGSPHATVECVLKKLLRTALCIRGYLGITKGELIFASPKIRDNVMTNLKTCVKDLNVFLHNFNLTAQIIANDDFSSLVLNPVIIASDDVADTSELFMRSFQLYQMFVSNSGIKPGTSKGDYGRAAKRIPRWATHSNQYNHKIIRAYFQIQNENNNVNRPSLKARCQDAQGHPDVYVQDFEGNFASMKSDTGKNHGKVFTDDGYHIEIWEEVKKILEKHRDIFLK